ncbi:MAG TPA: beta-L-arabinofuranosidase domain-containing protein [Puia sp.]|nr:beta-L-arabinofuranosidase domain-containing protein [Puia sp.]
MRKKGSFPISLILLLFSYHNLIAQYIPAVIKPLVPNAVHDIYVPSPYENQRIGGILGLRMEINLEKRLLEIDQETMLSGFLSRPGKQDWIGEHVGKYLETACNTWQYSHNPDLKKQMDHILMVLLSSQLADGYLGTYTPDKYWTSWDVWVHKYDLIGLIAYYKTFGYQPALDAAIKIGNLMVKTFGNNPGQLDIISAGEHVGMAATSILDPMVELYRYTGESRYLEFTRYILRAYNQKNGPKIIQDLLLVKQVNKVADGKAYEMLSNLVGIIKLYKLTGEKDLLQPVIIAWNDIVNNRLYITGTSSSFEVFQGKDELPATIRDNIGEGCVTTTWIQLNYQLFTLTAEVKYMDQVEKSVYNHLLAAENPQTGCVSYYTSLMDKKPYSCDITCCLSSVPRGISLIPLFNYGLKSGIPTFLLMESTEVKDSIFTNNKQYIGLSVKGISEFPTVGRIVYTVSPSRSSVFPVSFRVPGWTTRFTATVHGKKYSTADNGYLTIEKLWEPGEKIIIDFDIPVKIIQGGHNYKDFIAFQRGPQILSADSSLNHAYPLSISEKQLQNPKIKLNEDPAALTAGWIGNQAYSFTVSNGSKLVLVPFADAGQSGSKTQVWIPLRTFKSADN